MAREFPSIFMPTVTIIGDFTTTM